MNVHEINNHIVSDIPLEFGSYIQPLQVNLGKDALMEIVESHKGLVGAILVHNLKWTIREVICEPFP